MRNGDELLTTAQVAELRGYTVAWINKLAASGRLPVAHKLPGRTGAYLFRRDDVEAEASQQPAA
jgi:predicted DNA-binding transcriptional regulator AlpA